MLQHVNKVLIAKTAPASYTTVDALVDGDIALFNENKVIVKSASEAEAATALYIGVCVGKEDVYDQEGTKSTKSVINYSMPIQKGSKPSMVFTEFVAKAEDKVVITATDVTPEVGHRYVLRIVYNDIHEAPGQFTHTYEVYAASTDASALAAAIVKKINKHANRRINAAVAGAVITLTAMEKDDNEGVYSLSEYSTVSMEASLYVTIPGAILSNYPEAIPGATINKVEGTPGKGYWKQVRDTEVRFMGYQGHVFTGAYPIVEQPRMVEEGAEYNYITIENDNKYLSNDNQYIKTTPLTTEVYVKKAEGFTNSIVAKGIEAFISGEAA